MVPALASLLDELHSEGVAYDAMQSDRLDRRRNVEPETGALLGVLVRATSARRVLELGTSNGYSTLWLAEAAAELGGCVTSVEAEADRSASAAANLRRAGLADDAKPGGGRGRDLAARLRRGLGPHLPRRGAGGL